MKKSQGGPTTDLLSLVREDCAVQERRGKYWVCCPLHTDATPSLSIAPEKGDGVWHCFSCGQGGGTIRWLQVVRGWSLVEALKFLDGVTERLPAKVRQERERVWEAEKAFQRWKARRRYGVLDRIGQVQTNIAEVSPVWPGDAVSAEAAERMGALYDELLQLTEELDRYSVNPRVADWAARSEYEAAAARKES